MNRNIAHGKWQQLKGTLNVQWGHLTRDSERVMAGRRMQAVGGLDAAYGQIRAEVGRQIDGVRRRSIALAAKHRH